MLHTINPIIKHKAGLLNQAEELGNFSKAYKVVCPATPSIAIMSLLRMAVLMRLSTAQGEHQI